MYSPIFRNTCSLIKKWTPKNQYTSEEKYRDDLILFLREGLNRPTMFKSDPVTVKSESGRSLCDIAINKNQVGIELKKDLHTKSQIDRLVGQIHRYKSEYDSLAIVLVGDTKQNYYDELIEGVQEFGGTGFNRRAEIEVLMVKSGKKR